MLSPVAIFGTKATLRCSLAFLPQDCGPATMANPAGAQRQRQRLLPTDDQAAIVGYATLLFGRKQCLNCLALFSINIREQV